MPRGAMPRKKKWSLDDAFGVAMYKVPTFGTGEVAEVLKMPMWRIKKFLDLDCYQLSAATPGRGKGKRRMFSTEDLYRVAIADFLLKDGFAPRRVSNVLKKIEDKEFINYDEKGEATLGVYMTRNPITRERVVQLFRPDRSHPPKETYYSLDFGLPMGEVDQGIRKALEKRKKEVKTLRRRKP